MKKIYWSPNPYDSGILPYLEIQLLQSNLFSLDPTTGGWAQSSVTGAEKEMGQRHWDTQGEDDLVRKEKWWIHRPRDACVKNHMAKQKNDSGHRLC